MAIRNRHRKSYLIQDDESGFVRYADQVTTNPDGLVIEKRNYDEGFKGHPQQFVRAKNDPAPLYLVRPQEAVVVSSLTVPIAVGLTNVATAVGPATHLFRSVKNNVILYGLGELVIEGTGLDGFRIS